MAHTPALRKLIRLMYAARRNNLKAAGKPQPINRTQRDRRDFLKKAGALSALCAYGTARFAQSGVCKPARQHRDRRDRRRAGGPQRRLPT
jgi:hypothetical protein